jgi:tetratricopeptide (TPR) repeat protein
MLTSAREFVYRDRPLSNVAFRGDPFIFTLIKQYNDALLNELSAAETQYLLHHDQSAIHGLTQTINDYPDYIETYYFRGLIYLSTGDIRNGIIDLQRVVDRSNDPQLRMQAKREIVMAQLATLLMTPMD